MDLSIKRCQTVSAFEWSIDGAPRITCHSKAVTPVLLIDELFATSIITLLTPVASVIIPFVSIWKNQHRYTNLNQGNYYFLSNNHTKMTGWLNNHILEFSSPTQEHTQWQQVKGQKRSSTVCSIRQALLANFHLRSIYQCSNITWHEQIKLIKRGYDHNNLNAVHHKILFISQSIM